MIIKDESTELQFSTQTFHMIPYGAVFKGQTGYITYSTFMKILPDMAFDLIANRSMKISPSDMISHYEELDAYLVLNAKKA